MIFKYKFFTSLLIAFLIVASAFVFPFIPCKKMPNVPNPIESSFSLCTFDSEESPTLNSLVYYFGFINTPSKAMIALFLAIFSVIFLLLSLISMPFR